MGEPLPVDTIGNAGGSDRLLVRGAKRKLFRDYETRSSLKLRAVGTHRYATSPDTEVICCAYAVDDQPVKIWLPGDEVPAEFIEASGTRN
jgi:hypothetical protein